MKVQISTVFIFIAFSSIGQKIHNTLVPFDGKEVNAFSITFKDIHPFLQNIKAVLGPGDRYNNDRDGYPGLRWFAAQQADWANKKIIIRTYWIVMESKTILLINCVDESGDDLLLPDTETEKSIRHFFKKKLN